MINFNHFRDSLPKTVNLLAVSKGQSALKIRSLVSQGQSDFGESRVQEALPKLESLKDLTNIKWHFIGNIQTNKVRQVINSFDVIHSIDSLKLAKRVSRIAGEEFKKPKVMLQVKFRKDPNKYGFSPDELLEVWDELVRFPHMDITGLMTISPISLDQSQRKSLFRECRNFANKLKLHECSMGMSRDWKEAIGEGATWIRLGSYLF